MRLPVARRCGPCQACCYTTRVWVQGIGRPNLDKPPHQRCQFQCDTGCSIYAERPRACAAYTCLWLNGGLPYDADRPDVLGVVVELTSQAPGIAMISEVHKGARAHPRVRAIVAELQEALPAVVVMPVREPPIILGRVPTEDEVRSWAGRLQDVKSRNATAGTPDSRPGEVQSR